MKKVLSTKATDKLHAQLASSMGLELHAIDMVTISPVEYDPQEIPFAFDSCVFTSANAVKHFVPGAAAALKGKNIFSLSGNTALELSKHGLSPTVTASDANDLAEGILKFPGVKTVLHPCGDLALKVLEHKLIEAGITYEPLVVYQTTLLNIHVPENDYGAILFYSPSGVRSFLAANTLNHETVCCCIGHTTADALKQESGHANILIAKDPSPESMIETIAAHYKNTIKI